MNKYKYNGGCHCGNVRFEISLGKNIESTDITLCNCSICDKTGYLHLFVAKDNLTLHTDTNHLSSYQFNKKIAKHLFCSTCGIKSFYQPRSHPDCWSVNVRCLDGFSKMHLNIVSFDGLNWESSIAKLHQ